MYFRDKYNDPPVLKLSVRRLPHASHTIASPLLTAPAQRPGHSSLVRSQRPLEERRPPLMPASAARRILDSAHAALITGAMYWYCITNFNNLAAVQQPIWAIPVRPMRLRALSSLFSDGRTDASLDHGHRLGESSVMRDVLGAYRQL